MFKKRVISFFIIIVIILAFVTLIRISQFGSLTGYAVSPGISNLDDLNANKTATAENAGKQTLLSKFGPYLGYAILAFLIAFLTIRFVYRYQQRISEEAEKPFERNFIVIEGGKKTAQFNV